MNRKEHIIMQKVISEIDVIKLMIQGLDEEGFMRDEKTQRAVAMTLINIGELVKALPMDLRTQFPEIPWRAITGLRDIVAHKYQTLKMADIWLTVNSDIPPLKTMFIDILNNK